MISESGIRDSADRSLQGTGNCGRCQGDLTNAMFELPWISRLN